MDITSVLSHVAVAIVALSAGIVLGRLSKTPLGRWAAVIVVIALVGGAAYLYGIISAMQNAVALSAAAHTAATAAKTIELFGLHFKLPW